MILTDRLYASGLLSCIFYFYFLAEEILGVREHPGAAIGIALTAGLLLMRGINSMKSCDLVYKDNAHILSKIL